MRIEFTDGHSIEVADTQDTDQLVASIAKHPELDAPLRKVAASLYYSRFRSWEDLDTSAAGEITEALFDGGKDAAIDKIVEMTDEQYNESPEGFFRDATDTDGHTSDFITVMVDAAVDLIDDLDEDTFRSDLVEALQTRVADLMVDLDDSKPLDVIPNTARVEIFKILGADDKNTYTDDVQIDHESPVISVGTILPGDGLKELFEVANLNFSAFVDAVRQKRDVNLRGGDTDEGLVAWLAEEDYVGSRETANELALSRARAWAAFDPAYDPSKPSLLTPEQMITMIENADRGYPIYVARPRLLDLINHDWEKSMIFWPDDRYGTKSGGFLGIFNPDQGSGYVEMPAGPVALPPGTGGWKVSGRFGYEVDSVFGIVQSCYYTKISEDPRLVPELSSTPTPGM